MSRKLLRSCSELDTELVTVTEVEFEEASNDTIAENDGFVAPNYDYVTRLASMKTVKDTDDDNFINARILPFHDTDQVCKNIGDSNTGLSDFGIIIRKTPLIPVDLIFPLVDV